MKTKEAHRQRHIKLHHSLDELLADWIDHTGALPSKSTVLDLVEWSHRQTEDPEDKHGKFFDDAQEAE